MASIEGVNVSINNSEAGDGDRHDNIVPDNDERSPCPCTPLTRVSSFYTPSMENKLQRKLKFFFMDPCSKYTARRKIPWKLILQILKIIVVTVQVSYNTDFIKYVFVLHWYMVIIL